MQKEVDASRCFALNLLASRNNVRLWDMTVTRFSKIALPSTMQEDEDQHRGGGWVKSADSSVATSTC